MSFKEKSLILISASMTLAACSTGVLIGDQPSDPAPQIVYLGDKDPQTGKDYLTWRDVPSFGQVPAELVAIGDMSCMQYGMELRAIGYHPKALDRKGKEIPGGGFYCSPFFDSAQYSEAPRLIETSDGVVWDNPGAFNEIPEAEASRGALQCAENGQGQVALGFHPAPLDLDGNLIPNGGFLCAKPLQQY